MMKTIFYMTLCFLALSFEAISASVWQQKSSMPAVGRHRGTGLAIGNKGYIGLGHMNGTGQNIVYDDWWEYDPATNSWTQKANYPTGNYGALAFAIGNKGYVGGGVFLTNEFYAYDPISNTWSPIPPAPISPSDRTAFSLDGKGYITDGSALVEFDPNTQAWQYKQSPPTFLSAWCTSFVIQNSAYVKSGTNLFEYKASQDQWLVKQQFPGMINNGSSSFAVNQKGYIVTGYFAGLSDVNREVWEFNPTTNNWIQQPDFPGSSRRFSVSFSIGNKGYVGSGTSGTNMNDFWEYNRILTNESVSEQPITVKCYPIPAQDLIRFQLPSSLKNQAIQLKIYTPNGQHIQTINTTYQADFEFNAGSFNKGLYIFQIINEQTTYSGTFIMQ